MIGIVSFLSLLVTALVVAFFARRILGAPVGWPRSVLVGLIMVSLLGNMLPGLAQTIGLVDASGRVSQPALAGVMLGLIVAWAFFLSIAALVVLELIVPTGSVRSPMHALRELRQRLRRSRRYLEVLTIAARHGLGGFLRRSRRPTPTLPHESLVPRALRLALNDAGVTFIKFGQMLSTRPDLMPAAYIRELSMLQMSSAPLEWAQIEPELRASLGSRLSESFAEIDPEPLATASVGQVHAGVLVTGKPVVIKIQKRSARAQVTADIDIVQRLARRLDTSTAWGRSVGVLELADGFTHSLLEELDYTIEADNMAAVAAAGDAQQVAIPHVYADLSSATVLVMQRLSGRTVGAASDIIAAMPIEVRASAADKLLGAVLRQIMVEGVFHADLHPGNVLVDAGGQLGLLDFGSVGRLDNGSREALAMLMMAIDRDSSLAATDALLDLLDPPAEGLNERLLERDVGQLMARFRSGGVRHPELFGQLFGLVSRHRLGVPPQIAAAFRTLAALEGTLRLLDPSIDLVASTRRQTDELLSQQLTPGGLRKQLDSELLNLVPLLRRLPRRLNKISEGLEQGQLSLNVRVLADPGDRGFLLSLTHQVIVAVLAAAATVAAIVLLTATGGPRLAPGISWYSILGYCLLFVGCVLALRALVLVFRRPWAP
jgi:ubiquinone biosynthesis protein